MNDTPDTIRLVETWLAEPVPPLSDDVIIKAIDRLPATSQRRRWWPFRWFPLGIGATRSAELEGPPSLWRSRQMLNTTRIAAIGAIVVLAGTLALVGGTLKPASHPAGVPGAAALPQHENVPFRVIGTSSGATMPEPGSSILEGEMLQIRDRLGRDEVKANDPRASGTMTYLHHIDSMGEMGTEWGTLRLENDDGAWEGAVNGYFTFAETRTSGWLEGEDAYEGLTFFLESVIEHSTMESTFEGLIFEGSPPTDPPTFD